MAGISAVIPCYNVRREYLSCVLDSISAQTFQDYEVILVDDGSLKEFHEFLSEAIKKTAG